MEIEKKLLGNPEGKIIILEGLWATGKTTLCQYLQKFYKFHFIQEPNHIKAKIRSKDREGITNWYFEEHLRNLKGAFDLTKKGINVAIERSPISAIAFAKSFFSENLPLRTKINELENLLKRYKNNPYLILLKHPDRSSLTKILSKNKNMVIYSDLEFLEKFEKYLLFFANLFKKKSHLNVLSLTANKYLKKNFRNIISKIL